MKKETLSEFCQEYLRKKDQFRWFIEKYFGLKVFVSLWELAEQNKEQELREDLDSIWYRLPGTVFNLQNNPPGWATFVSLLDD